MTTSRSHRRTRLAAVTSAALAFAGLQLVAAAQPPRARSARDLVIREVYGGGGNAHAPYNADFVELYNRRPARSRSPGWGLAVPPDRQRRGRSQQRGGALPDQRAGEHAYLVEMSDARSGRGRPARAGPDRGRPDQPVQHQRSGPAAAHHHPDRDCRRPRRRRRVIDMVGYGPGNATTANNSSRRRRRRSCPTPRRPRGRRRSPTPTTTAPTSPWARRRRRTPACGRTRVARPVRSGGDHGFSLGDGWNGTVHVGGDWTAAGRRGGRQRRSVGTPTTDGATR